MPSDYMVHLHRSVHGCLFFVHINLLNDRHRNHRSEPGKDEDEYLKDLTMCIRDHRLILEYDITTLFRLYLAFTFEVCVLK